jgi:hypothetical protein
VTPPPQQAPYRQSNFAREIIRLIESPPQKTHGMQRDGHHRIGAFEHLQPAPAHQTGQRFCKLAPPLELEGVNQLTQRAFVRAGTARQGKRGRPASATPAETSRERRLWQLITASVAERRD